MGGAARLAWGLEPNAIGNVREADVPEALAAVGRLAFIVSGPGRTSPRLRGREKIREWLVLATRQLASELPAGALSEARHGSGHTLGRERPDRMPDASTRERSGSVTGVA